MKPSFFFSSVLWCLSTAVQVTSQDTSSSPQALEREPNSTVWQTITLSTDDEGQTVSETNSFTELATGLNFFNSTTGQWEESQEVFEITPKGDAIATKGQHQVILAGDINSGGSVDLLTPDGLRLLSNPVPSTRS